MASRPKSQIHRLARGSDLRSPTQTVARFRLLLIAAGLLFPGWTLLLATCMPLAETAYGLRCLVGLACFAVVALSYRSLWLRQHIEAVCFGAGLVIQAINLYLVQVHDLNAQFVLGYVLCALAISLIFDSQRKMFGFMLLVGIMPIFVHSATPQTPKLFFVIGNITAILLSLIAFHDKVQLLMSLVQQNQRHERSRSILNETQKLAKLGGWTYDLAKARLWWSEQTYAIHAMSPKLPITLEAAIDFFAPEARYLIRSAIQKASLDGIPFDMELPLINAAGARLWVRVTCKIDEDKANERRHLLGSIQDITMERRLSEELVAREAYTRAIIDAIPGYVSWIDADLHYLGVNRAIADIYGMSPEEFIGQQVSFIHSNDNVEVNAFMRDVFATNTPGLTRQVTVNRQGGINGVLLLTAKKYRDGREAVIIGLDISERDRMERELSEEKELLAQVLDNIPLGIYAKDAAVGNRYVIWNQAMEAISGRSRGEVLTAKDEHLYGPAESERLRGIERDVMSKRRLMEMAEETMQTKSRLIPVNTKRIPVYRSDGQPRMLLGVVEDITEKKQREQLIKTQQIQLMHASKMSTLGEMSGGVAHEINNPLTVIMGFSGKINMLVRQEAPPRDELQRCAEKISAMTERIAKIVRGLKTFAREGSHDPFENTTVQFIVNETLELCRQRFLNNGVDLRLPLIEATLELSCRAVQITQVLLNLLNNAYDAVLTLPTRWVQLEIKDLGDAVAFAVIDSGNGIPPEVAAKILQPFFTTKAVGQGTGLGLSISRGIIESHSGSLYYDPECANTRFIFVLPKATPEAIPSPKSQVA